MLGYASCNQYVTAPPAGLPARLHQQQPPMQFTKALHLHSMQCLIQKLKTWYCLHIFVFTQPFPYFILYWNIIFLPNKSHKSYCLLKYFWELCGRTIKRTKLRRKENQNIKIVEYWIWDNSGMIFCQQSKFNLKFPTSAESVFSQMWMLVAGGSNTSSK